MNSPEARGREIADPDRRQFIARMRNLGGLLLMVGLVDGSVANTVEKFGADGMPNGWSDDPLTFVHLGKDGVVTVTVHRSEMGQGVRTSMALIVADELEADWSKVRVAQAPADEARYGNQDTDGSRSIRHFAEPMRHCGAAMRMMLEQAAATTLGVPVSDVSAACHEVIHGQSGRRVCYGVIAESAARLPVPPRSEIRLKAPSAFRYIGKGDRGLVDGADIVAGRAKYGIDTRIDGMFYAVVARCPVYGGTVARFDASDAQRVDGVVRVMKMPSVQCDAKFRPLAGVAVIARDTWTAIKARDALKIEWDYGANATYNSEQYAAELTKLALTPGKILRQAGEGDKAFDAAGHTIESTYYLPHLSHVPMEPPSATARLVNGHCEVWAPTQAPQVTRQDIAKHLGLTLEDVTVHVTLLGGGFGRKSKPDFATEAALLAKAMEGAPVKVIWTREDDIRGDYYHTVSVEHVRAAVDAAGRPLAWLHRSLAPSIVSTFGADPGHQANFEHGMGLINFPAMVPNLQIENPPARAHTRIGWFRSVSNIPHAFAVQTAIAELAAAAGRDHRDFLLDMIGPARVIDPTALGDTWNHGESPQRYPVDTGRLRRVIEVVTREGEWGRNVPKGTGLGLAAHYSFLTYVAALFEVSVGKTGELSVHSVHIAIDCGPQINPERIRSQMEGAAMMGISLATAEAVTFKDGQAEQGNYHQYQVARINQAPKVIHVHFVGAADWSIPMGGVGEPGLPPIAPALCNAIYAATGRRLHRLPIADQLVQT